MADNLKEHGMVMKGYIYVSIYQKLKEIIETVTLLGDILIGMLTIFAYFLGVISSITEVLFSIIIIYGLYEDIRTS